MTAPQRPAANSEARKRMNPERAIDPAIALDRDVRYLLAQARAEAWEHGYQDAAAYFRRGQPLDGPMFSDNPYRSAS